MSSETVLSEQEILALWRGEGSKLGTIDLIRIYEAAVLAKVAIRERTKERAAFTEALRYCERATSELALRHQDRLYPDLTPTPKPSREITLSNTYSYRRLNGAWQMFFMERMVPTWDGVSCVPVLTLDDCQQCVALLKEEGQ